VNDPATRRRLTWVIAIGGALLVAVLFISFAAPSPGASGSPVLVPASDPPPPADVRAPGTGAGFSLGPGDLISLAWRLALVVAVIAVSIFALRWWARRMAAPRSPTGFLRIVDTLPISNGRTIHLLALGDRVIAIGATPQHIAMLEELSPDDAAQVLAAADATRDPLPLGDFAAQLLDSMRRTAGRSTAGRDPVIGRDTHR
jgi:flagellar biogenesis protein FliO